MGQQDHERLELASSGSAVRHAILFFPLRVIVLVFAGLRRLVGSRQPAGPRSRFDGLSEEAMLSRLGQNRQDDLHLLRALLAQSGADRVIATWARMSASGRESVIAQAKNRALRWSIDLVRICEHALDDPAQTVAREAEEALCKRTMEWIEREHPSLAARGAFTLPPSSLDYTYLRDHVEPWRGRNRASLTRLAKAVERRLRHADQLRGMLDRWCAFPKDGSAVSRPSFPVSFRLAEKLDLASEQAGVALLLDPSTHAGELRVTRSSNYAADTAPIPAVFELTVPDAQGHRWSVEIDLDDFAIFSGAIEATHSAKSAHFMDADPAWQASFWKSLVIHPTVFALEGFDGDAVALPGGGELVLSDGELAAYAVAVVKQPEQGTVVAVLVTELGAQARSDPVPPFVVTVDLATFLLEGADRKSNIRARRVG